MNKERIKYAISIMEQAKNLDMQIWQGCIGKLGTPETPRTPKTTINQLHECGNTACFAGYLALSPLFQELGGKVGVDGEPVLNGLEHLYAVSSFFELGPEYEPVVESLVLGGLGSLESGRPLEDYEEPDLIKKSSWVLNLMQQINEVVGGTHWEDWKPDHVIKLLKSLLDGEFDWLLEEGNE